MKIGSSFSRGMAIAMHVMTMMADGKITVDEIVTAGKAVASLYGVDLSQEAGKVSLFMEMDGDLHIIVKRDVLERLNVEMEE